MWLTTSLLTTLFSAQTRHTPTIRAKSRSGMAVLTLILPLVGRVGGVSFSPRGRRCRPDGATDEGAHWRWPSGLWQANHRSRRAPSSVSLREPPSPARGEGYV